MALEYDGQRVGAMMFNGHTIGEAMIDGVVVYRSIVTVTPLPPTFHDGEPWVTLPTVEGVTYSVEGTPGYDASVTVTATAQAGYELVGTSTWSHTYGPDPRPVVTITGTSSVQSRDQFRQACVDHGTTHQTVEVLPFQLDTSRATSMSNMFNQCTNLTTVPAMDLSRVTVTNSMFFSCSSLVSVPDMDTHNVEYANYMFNGCTVLTDGNVHLIGKHSNVRTNGMITGSGLTREPFYDQAGNPI